MATPKTTHYLRHDEPGQRLVKAMCGAYVAPKDHANEPTCDVCKQELAAFQALDLGELGDLVLGEGGL